jgi:hypothetical protein
MLFLLLLLASCPLIASFLEYTLIGSIDSGEIMCKVEMNNLTDETAQKQPKKQAVSNKVTKFKKAPGAPR